MKNTILLFVLLISVLASMAQNVGINTDGTAPHGSAMLDVKSTNSGILIPRMTEAQKIAITTPAEGLLIYQTDGTSGFYYRNGSNAWTLIGSGSGNGTHYLGEEYLGGIIFYLYTDNTGTQKGLIVSKTETTAIWSGSSLVGADRTEDGTYNMNLMPTGTGTARTWVATLGAGWYLPSIDELSILWHNRYHVNKTARAVASTLLSSLSSSYWSSTEWNATTAFAFSFYCGYPSGSGKTTAYSVRAVRAF